jgi:hypothetical protein
MAATFTPTHEWQHFPEDAIAPEGCEFRIDPNNPNVRHIRLANGHGGSLDDLDQEYDEQQGGPAPASPTPTDSSGNPAWAEPVDIIGAPEMVGWPGSHPGLLARAALLIRQGRVRTAERRPVRALCSRAGGDRGRLQRRLEGEAEAARRMDAATPALGMPD